jgi:hypothetical protein
MLGARSLGRSRRAHQIKENNASAGAAGRRGPKFPRPARADRDGSFAARLNQLESPRVGWRGGEVDQVGCAMASGSVPLKIQARTSRREMRIS